MQLALNYGPRPAYRHDWAQRVYLVWPCAAWRVVAPMPSDRRINVLQKAVLGLSRCGSFTVSEIAARLHLHPQLIETIGMELVGSGWVDPKTWRPTSKGLAMLKEEEEAMDSLVSGWVFQDPWTGDLWPFFARQLKLQEAIPASGHGRLSLSLETGKGTIKVYAWCLDSPPSPGQPATEMVLKAIKLFRRREKLKGSIRWAESGLDDFISEGSSEMLARIAFISDQPEPVGLVTYGYLPEGGGLPPQICDPFGFVGDDKMWRHLQNLAGCDDAASAAHREFLRLAQVKDAPAFTEQLKLHRLAAEAQLLDSLSLNIKSFPAIFDHLADAQNYLSLAIKLGTDPQGQLASTIQFCRKALEALLKEVARQSPLTDAYKSLTGNASLDRATVEKIASDVGFTSPLPEKIREAIGGGSDTKERIKGIGRNLKNVFSLNAAIVATLLACSRDSMHPFRQAAKRDPELITKFIAIIDAGNPASHDESHNSRPRHFTASEAMAIHDLTIEVVASLLNLPLRKAQSYGKE